MNILRQQPCKRKTGDMNLRRRLRGNVGISLFKASSANAKAAFPSGGCAPVSTTKTQTSRWMPENKTYIALEDISIADIKGSILSLRFHIFVIYHVTLGVGLLEHVLLHKALDPNKISTLRVEHE